jgi:hypothetical protein
MPYDQRQVVSVYLSTFANRTDVYSRWDAEKQGWRPSTHWALKDNVWVAAYREPLTVDVVIAGLTGTGPSVSAYMIAPGSLAHCLAIDFDTDNGLEQAFVLGKTMWGADLPAYVETSRRGAHLWCVISDVLPAATVRKAARALMAAALLPTDDPHIEIRPGSDHVDAVWHEHVSGAVVGEGLGHSLRMPLMPHPKTGKRGVMNHPMRHPISAMSSNLAELMLDIEHAPSAEILKWAGRWNPAVTVIPPTWGKPHQRREDDDASACEILRTLWGVVDPAPGRNSHCPAHGRDRNPSLTVMKDDKRAICRVPGCVLNNDDKGRGTWELRTMAPRNA